MVHTVSVYETTIQIQNRWSGAEQSRIRGGDGGGGSSSRWWFGWWLRVKNNARTKRVKYTIIISIRILFTRRVSLLSWTTHAPGELINNHHHLRDDDDITGAQRQSVSRELLSTIWGTSEGFDIMDLLLLLFTIPVEQERRTATRNAPTLTINTEISLCDSLSYRVVSLNLILLLQIHYKFGYPYNNQIFFPHKPILSPLYLVSPSPSPCSSSLATNTRRAPITQ